MPCDLVAADEKDPVLRAAVAWPDGLKKPSAAFLTRMTASLSESEGRQLLQAHEASCKAIIAQDTTGAKFGRQKRRSVLLTYKLGLCKAFLAWMAQRGLSDGKSMPKGKQAKGAITRFIREASASPLTSREMQKERMLLCRSIRQYEDSKLAPLAQETSQRRVRRFKERFRIRSQVGAHVKAGLVREELYEWFCRLKRSVRGRIPPAFMLQKASTLVEEYVTACLQKGIKAKAPVLSHNWLREWRLAYGVCFRKPNRKWKVAAHILSERLRIAWENVFRVRAMAIKLLGYDLDLDNLDQSPFHMNEAGSKAEKSLSIRGGGIVPLKEGHAQTRERWTLQTTTTSNPSRARDIPPVEVMFKAQGERVQAKAQAVVPSWAPWLTVKTSPKGSYREDDVLDFIEKRLEPQTPERPWRILLLDAYAAHLSDRVRACAWHKGYVVITHGGGASAVAQTNDTDLHAHVKRQYLELEMADAAEQMRLQPRGVPCPRRDDVIGWVSCIWGNPHMHLQACRGFVKVGMSNALDGSEDAEIVREAAQFWHREGMRQRREEILHDVHVELEGDRLRWNYHNVYSVVNPFPSHGKRNDTEPSDKGSDSDSAAGARNNSDTETASVGSIADDINSADERCDTCGNGEQAAESKALALKRPLDEITESMLQVAQDRLQSMQVVLQQVQTIGNLSLEAQVQKAIHMEEKKIRLLARENPDVTQAFYEEQDAEQLKTRRDMASIRKAFHQDRCNRQSIKDLMAQQEKLRLQQLELARASTLVECEKVLKSWDLDDLGQGHAAGGTRQHAKNRVAILERLRARSKPLPPDLANDWHWFLKHWDAARVRLINPAQRNAWALDFLGIIKTLLRRLREDEDALAVWMRQERAKHLSLPALRL